MLLCLVGLGTSNNEVSDLPLCQSIFVCLTYSIAFMLFGIKKRKKNGFFVFFFFFLGFCLKIFQPLRMVYINKGKPKLKEASGLAVGNS